MPSTWSLSLRLAMSSTAHFVMKLRTLADLRNMSALEVLHGCVSTLQAGGYPGSKHASHRSPSSRSSPTTPCVCAVRA